jgi:hypothetical protein
MKSLKYIFSIASIILLISCSNNETEENVFTIDSDRDGVTNYQESLDNTDPNDPCSLKTSSQYAPAISSEWKLMDCDGDGVNNEQELADGTYMLDPMYDVCDYVTEHQDLSMVSDFWKSVDCDGDGVSNQQEIIDQTDLKDSCDFLSASQISPSEIWLNLDCDEDGVNNQNEINDGTDPLDSNSYLGAGDKLRHVTFLGNQYFFLNDGDLFDKAVNSDGEVITKFQYDSENRLTHAFALNSNFGDFNISFSYVGNNISAINYIRGSLSIDYTVTYEGLKIHLDTNDQNLPNGYHGTTYTFDSSGKILYSESFRPGGADRLIVGRRDYNYNGANGALGGTVYETQYLNLITQTHSSTEYTDDWVKITNGYSLEGNVKNPTFNAGQNIYVQGILMPDMFNRMWSLELSFLSETYVSGASEHRQTFAGSTSVSETYRTDIVQPNQHPRFAIWERWGTEHIIEFFYTE